MSREDVPAAGRSLFTALYDPAMALTMREQAWRPLVLDRFPEAGTEGGKAAGHLTILDIGCGTGSMTGLIADRSPNARVIGVDPDSKVLELARRKAEQPNIEWKRGRAGDLGLQTESADAAVLSLVLHHLSAAGKSAALREAARVLRGGAPLIVADWGPPSVTWTRPGFLLLRTLDGFENTSENARGEIPGLLAASGFAEQTTFARIPTIWGTLNLIEAR